MKWFSKNKEDIPSEESLADEQLSEKLSEMSAQEDKRTVDRARSAAEETISHAALADIKGIALMERGRCPECGSRTKALVYAWTCPSCGWYLQFDDRYGNCRVLMDNSETIDCDRVFNVKGDEMICVKDDVIISKISKRCVLRIDYLWTDDDLQRARERSQKERSGSCAWCQATLNSSEEDDGPFEEYVAFGAFQERYLFCSIPCLESFRKQYPVRVHRNCYDTDCRDCSECYKRYDTKDFRRIRPYDRKKIEQ